MTSKYRHSIAGLLATACIGFNGSAIPATKADSGLLPSAEPDTMVVDILPGNPENTIDLGRQRLVAVAIMGSASLDVNELNPRTLSLEATEQNLVGKSDKSWCSQQDIDADSHMDLICNIKTIGFRVKPGDIAVVISVGTYHRQSLRASGVLRYVAE